jgi:hypothetical protein
MRRSVTYVCTGGLGVDETLETLVGGAELAEGAGGVGVLQSQSATRSLRGVNTHLGGVTGVFFLAAGLGCPGRVLPAT